MYKPGGGSIDSLKIATIEGNVITLAFVGTNMNGDAVELTLSSTDDVVVSDETVAVWDSSNVVLNVLQTGTITITATCYDPVYSDYYGQSATLEATVTYQNPETKKIKIGSATPSNIYLGTEQINKAYAGSVVIWEIN